LSYAITQKRSLGPADGRWLLVAVALHALILLIPSNQLPKNTLWGSAELMVRLISIPQEVESESFDDEPVRVETPMWPRILKKVELPARTNPLEKKESEAEVMKQEEILPADTLNVSSASLMGMRSSLTDKVPLESDNRIHAYRLGAPRSTELPANWQPHVGAEALAPLDNTFNGMTVPEAVEIVDRWVAIDGSHNVIVETPAGLRLCGRARAWDPMRPMIEPLMQFSVCGGDGARPFRFKRRERPDRNFVDPVAKDANQPQISPE
jgi:hypothetical protein